MPGPNGQAESVEYFKTLYNLNTPDSRLGRADKTGKQLCEKGEEEEEV